MPKRSRIQRKQEIDANPRVGQRKKLSLILGVLVALVTSLYTLSFIGHVLSRRNTSVGGAPNYKANRDEQALSWKSELGQFPPRNNAERELEKMLHNDDADIDLALANWLIVSDIPEFNDLTREDYLGQLDTLTEETRQDMAKMQAKGWPNSDSDDPKTRCRRFCSAIIGLHFGYAEEFREENLTPAMLKGLYGNPNNIFLAGLLRTKRGSCVSMPMIYLVIGRRLGMPVFLVTIGKHCFIRWDEPHFRMNIETTSTQKIAWTPDESVYLDTEGITRDQLKGTDSQNLTSREMIGLLFHLRSAYWHVKQNETQSFLDLARADFLAPDDPNIKAAHDAVFSHYGVKLEQRSIEIRFTNSSTAN